MRRTCLGRCGATPTERHRKHDSDGSTALGWLRLSPDCRSAFTVSADSGASARLLQRTLPQIRDQRADVHLLQVGSVVRQKSLQIAVAVIFDP